MTLMLKLAWRNIFRNKRRTLLTGSVIGLGLASIMFTDALVIGTCENMIAAATETFMGHAQIHAKGFMDTFEAESVIKNSAKVFSALSGEKNVSGWAPRTLTYGMLSSPANVAAVLAYGIDPEKEKSVSRVSAAVTEGEYLSGESGRILIGKKLARTLEAGIGDKVVLTVAQAGTGDLSQELFRVGGIFSFGESDMDGRMAFIEIKSARKLAGVSGIHEIALKFKDADKAGDIPAGFLGRYSFSGNEALSWKELVPDLNAALEFTRFSTLILGVIIFGVVCVGIINTLFMSLYERMFEFGVLRAVGTRPVAMGTMIMLEAGCMALLSVFMGMILGGAVTWVVSVKGIHYNGVEFAGVTIQSIFPVMKMKQFIVFPAYVFILTLIAAVYPAVHASRIAPVEAMRKV